MAGDQRHGGYRLLPRYYVSRRRGKKKIRQYLIDNNFIDCIIQLPGNMFFGTSIATCIMVLKKARRRTRRCLFVDASKEFVKVTNNNKLTEDNIAKNRGVVC